MRTYGDEATSQIPSTVVFEADGGISGNVNEQCLQSIENGEDDEIMNGDASNIGNVSVMLE